ncbi:unnamed protein product [Closterium sp. NIES-54]
MIHIKRGELYLGEREVKQREDLSDHMRLHQYNCVSCPAPRDLQAKVALQLTKGEQEGTEADHGPSVQVLGRAGRTVASAPPPLPSAVTSPAPAAAPVSLPLPSPSAVAAAPVAAVGTRALPSPTAAASAPTARAGTPALPSPVAVMTPPLLATAVAATTGCCSRDSSSTLSCCGFDSSTLSCCG